VNSRDKGKRGEREAIRWLRSFWPNAGRTLAGRSDDVGDVTEVGPFAVSVKRSESFRVHEWLADVTRQRDQAGKTFSFVMARRSRERWVFLVDERTMALFLAAVHNVWNAPGPEVSDPVDSLAE
jgi:hypothetical protein